MLKIAKTTTDPFLFSLAHALQTEGNAIGLDEEKEEEKKGTLDRVLIWDEPLELRVNYRIVFGINLSLFFNFSSFVKKTCLKSRV